MPQPVLMRCSSTAHLHLRSRSCVYNLLKCKITDKNRQNHLLGDRLGRTSCACRCQLYTISHLWYHRAVLISALCLWNSAPLCLTLESHHISPPVIWRCRALLWVTTCWAQAKSPTPTTLYIYTECIYIHINEERDQTFPSHSISLLWFSNLAPGFPQTLLEFLLRFSQDRKLRGLGGPAGACARRAMRGERHTLIVESSLAESSSSWSAGLNATEFTTSSCARRARQML